MRHHNELSAMERLRSIEASLRASSSCQEKAESLRRQMLVQRHREFILVACEPLKERCVWIVKDFDPVKALWLGLDIKGLYFEVGKVVVEIC